MGGHKRWSWRREGVEVATDVAGPRATLREMLGADGGSSELGRAWEGFGSGGGGEGG